MTQPARFRYRSDIKRKKYLVEDDAGELDDFPSELEGGHGVWVLGKRVLLLRGRLLKLKITMKIVLY